MMTTLEEACEEADNLMNLAKRRPSSVPLLQHKNGNAFFSIQNRLRRLYYEECAKHSLLPIQDLNATSLLLEKLVAREQLNTLIVNLYPGNKGYSLAMRHLGNPETVTETVQWPYQMDTFLSYLDNGELPFMLVDLLEETFPDVFYSGCIIAEVRDYRQSYPHFSFHTHHILLQPTNQSVISDVNLLAAQSDLNSEEKILLESELVLATQGPLCLDPSPSLVLIHSTAQHKRNLLSTEPLRRCARKFSQVTVNRKRKLDQFTCHPHLPLYDLISRRRGRSSGAATPGQSKHKKFLDSITLEIPQIPLTRPLEMVPPPLSPPVESAVDVANYVRTDEWPKPTSDCSPQLVEEYILEVDRGNGQINMIKISVLQRISNFEFLGELYVDKDYKEGEQNGRSCRFPFASRLHANHYIQRFTEIFTEEGRKSVRITHKVPGQPPRVSITPGMKERDAKAAAQAKLLPRSSLGTVTSTTNSVTRNVPCGNVAANTNAAVVISNIEGMSSPASGSNVISSTNPSNSASSNVNLVNALSSPPMTGFTNILNSSLTTGLLSPSSSQSAPSVSSSISQPLMHLQGSVIDSSQQSQLKQQLQMQTSQPLQIIQPQQSQILQSQVAPSQQSQQQPVQQIQLPQQANAAQQQTIVQQSQLRSQLETKESGRTTNPAISALVTSLMNSAQHFEQAKQQQQKEREHQLQQQQLQQTAVKQAGITSTSVANLAGGKLAANALISPSGQKIIGRKNILNPRMLTPAQQQQLQQQLLQQQQQRVSLSTLTAQLSTPPANEVSILQHSLSPQVRFSAPNRPSGQIQVTQNSHVDSEVSSNNQVSLGGTSSSAVPLYEINPSNFTSLVNDFNSSDLSNFSNSVTLNSLSPNANNNNLNSAANFDLRSLVDGALVADNSVSNFEISVSNAGAIPNYEIRHPTTNETNSNTTTNSDLDFESALANSTNNGAAVSDFLNQSTSGAQSFQITIPDLNAFENSDSSTVQNNFDFANVTSYTTVPLNNKTVAVSSNTSVPSHGNVANSNLLRILPSASAAIRRLSANAAVSSSTGANDSSANAHRLTALSAMLAGTPSADNPIPGSSNSLSGSSLLERLAASSSTTSAAASSSNVAPPPLQFAVPSPSKPSVTLAQTRPATSPAASPATPKSPALGVTSPLSSPPLPNQQGMTLSGVNLQGLNLTSLQGSLGMQNVQVSFPAISTPISLYLGDSNSTPHIASAAVVPSSGVSGPVVTGTAAVASSPHTMVLTNSQLSVPVAQIMSSGVKTVGSQGNLRGIAANSIHLQQGPGQSIQLVGTLQRAKSGVQSVGQAGQTVGVGQANKASVLTGRQLQAAVLGTAQRKMPSSNSGASLTGGNQVIFSQQQLHILQKQAHMQQLQQLQQQQQPLPSNQQQTIHQPKTGVVAAAMTPKRRRSNATDGAAK